LASAANDYYPVSALAGGHRDDSLYAGQSSEEVKAGFGGAEVAVSAEFARPVEGNTGSEGTGSSGAVVDVDGDEEL